jgi:hypothetical protein
MKKQIIIFIISIICLSLTYGIAHSYELIFSDDFERADIGGDWTTGAFPSDTNTIALVSGRVQATADGNFIETVQEFSGNLRIEMDLEKVGSSDHTCWDFGVGLKDLNQYSGLIRFDWGGVDGVGIGPKPGGGCGDDVTISSGVNKGKAIFTYQDGNVGFSFENDDGDIIDAGSVYAGDFDSSRIRIYLAAHLDTPRYIDNVRIYSFPAVDIDIKPGSYPNSINPRSKGKIPVAILSSMDFDAPTEVDMESLTFGPTGDEESLAFCSRSSEDVNDDGYDDLVCHFYTRNAEFQCADSEGILIGKTVDDTPLEGSDSVRIVPSACH